MGSLIFRLGQRSFPIGLNSLKLLLVLHEKTSSEALTDWKSGHQFWFQSQKKYFWISAHFQFEFPHSNWTWWVSLSLSLSLLLEKSNLQTQCTHTHNFGKLIYISLLQSKQPPPNPPLLRQGATRGGCRPPSCILCACVTHTHTYGVEVSLAVCPQRAQSEQLLPSSLFPFLLLSPPSLSPLYPFLFPSLLSPPFCFPNIKLSLSRLSSL